MTTKVSVVMSVYNEPKSWIKKCVESILFQTHTNVEFIIVNDGSSKIETRNELNNLASKDERIRLFNNKNIGLTKSLNFAVSKAESEIIFRQDADDWSNRFRIQKQLEILESNLDIILLGTDSVFCNKKGKPLLIKKLPTDHDSILNTFPNGNPFCHGSVCFKKDKFDSVNGYDDEMKYSQDYDLFWRLSKSGKVTNIDEPLYFLRKTGSSISSINGIEQMKYDRLIRMKNAENFFLENKKKHLNLDLKTKENKKKLLIRNGDELLLAGEFLLSFKAYVKAFYYYLDVTGLVKLIRLLLWILLPVVRHKLFLTPHEKYKEREK